MEMRGIRQLICHRMLRLDLLRQRSRPLDLDSLRRWKSWGIFGLYSVGYSIRKITKCWKTIESKEGMSTWSQNVHVAVPEGRLILRLVFGRSSNTSLVILNGLANLPIQETISLCLAISLKYTCTSGDMLASANYYYSKINRSKLTTACILDYGCLRARPKYWGVWMLW